MPFHNALVVFCRRLWYHSVHTFCFACCHVVCGQSRYTSKKEKGGKRNILHHQLKGAAWSIRCLHWPCSIYGDTASAEVRAFTLLVLCGAAQSCWAELLWRNLSRKVACVNTGPPSPTYRQPIMSMWSYTEHSALLKHVGGARRCGTEINLAS